MIGHGEIDNAEWYWVFTASAVLLVLISVPFVWAYAVAEPDAHFMGILNNPIDGASYAAKMYQGLQGDWLVKLPFTPEPHHGILISTFYVALGHLARLLQIEIMLVFHAARLIGALVMLLALYRFVSDWTDDVTQRHVTWALAALGSGFGCVALLFNVATPDLLVLPEAFPLQAAYTNVHFPWSIAAGALVAHVLVRVTEFPQADRLPSIYPLALMAAGLFLGFTQPFILVPLGIGFAAWCIARWRWLHINPLRALGWGAFMLVSAGLAMAYNIWGVTRGGPVFSAWYAANVTLSPPVWHYLVAFAPLLILAAVGIWGGRKQLAQDQIFLLVWFAAGALLLYAPLGLQRRFSIGLIMPLAVFAGIGLWRVVVPRVGQRMRSLVVLGAFAVSVPTTLIAVLLPLAGVLVVKGLPTGDYYFVSNQEIEALQWIADQPIDAPLVLASPEISLRVPLYGGRVVYAHPMETVDADHRRQTVLAFYQGVSCGVIDREGVNFVFVGRRERALAAGGKVCEIPGEPVFTSSGGEVTIYAVTSQ